jgi:hypothetical protein
MRTTWLVRPQDVSPTEDALRASAHAVAATFDDIRV